ncbi:hypothetical protein [Rhizobium leguminosarum]|uniref:hypothetical protein n=1 Tax=Rhizobium leguminosarum TaxID=384 RepID=UPI001C9833DF|nr:hypothetical protein [Rhizobium leguminosarum]MBY5808678.1 hypothetical protein [Rhizobium leguminosarum]
MTRLPADPSCYREHLNIAVAIHHIDHDLASRPANVDVSRAITDQQAAAFRSL